MNASLTSADLICQKIYNLTTFTELLRMRLGAVLYVYKGEWGLPSIDFECLRALCLVRFPRCPLKVETCSNPLRSGEGKLPYLQIGTEKFVGYRKIKDLLEKEGYPIDGKLSSDEKFVSEAYTNLVFNNLHAYYYYFMFGDETNLDKTRALYAKRTPFPFNFYYPSSYYKEAEKVVSILGGFDLYEKHEYHESDAIVANAKRCVNMLSKKLGKKIWFFNDSYSELDGIVYSYLSILYHISLPSNPLQLHIRECPNLVRFINRISKDIFQRENFNSLPAAAKVDPMLTPTERDFLATKKTTQILAGLSAVVAMGVYAAWSGILQVTIDGSEHHFEYDDEDDD